MLLEMFDTLSNETIQLFFVATHRSLSSLGWLLRGALEGSTNRLNTRARVLLALPCSPITNRTTYGPLGRKAESKVTINSSHSQSSGRLQYVRSRRNIPSASSRLVGLTGSG